MLDLLLCSCQFIFIFFVYMQFFHNPCQWRTCDLYAEIILTLLWLSGIVVYVETAGKYLTVQLNPAPSPQSCRPAKVGKSLTVQRRGRSGRDAGNKYLFVKERISWFILLLFNTESNIALWMAWWTVLDRAILSARDCPLCSRKNKFLTENSGSLLSQVLNWTG